MEPAGAGPRASVPISMGSPRFLTAAVDGFQITDAWFPPFLRLPPHLHERASFAVMLEGSFDVLFQGGTEECPANTALTEPALERHGNVVGRAGAHVLVLQPDPAGAAILGPCAALFDAVSHRRDPAIAAMAWRLASELRDPDPVSPLVLEGTALEMLAATARLRVLEKGPRPPAWLGRARDLLHARFLERFGTAEVAREVGVHPVHLARVFRTHHGTTIGAYVRGLRLDWAAGRLARTGEPLSDIALEAGFSDQSHFTRAFKRHHGTTPDRFRRRLTPTR